MLGALVLRMRQLQVEEADQFRLLADENRINVRLLAPSRGLIYDRNGRIIAENEANYRVVLVREDAGDTELVLERLGQIITISPDDLEKVRKELKRRSAFVPVTVADRLSWADMAEISVNAPALPGITPDVGLSRSYPLGPDFAHIVGYVGPVTDYDLANVEDEDPLLQIPKFQIGKTGIENRFDRDLRGKAGSKRIEVNSVGRVMRELDRIEGQSGDTLSLTIDADLQNYVQARLAGQSASAVVMDTENGDLVAIGSVPAFDPNKFVRGISSKDYGQLTDDPYRPLSNKAVGGAYPPGSTYKMIVALSALEAGLIDPSEIITCNGFIEVSGRRFHCWKRRGHGQVDLRKSLVESCDVYYYELAQRVGIDKMTEMARRFGMGQKFPVPMTGISHGLAPTKDWKKRNRKQDWLIGDSLNAAIGQGYVLSSPLQLAVMTARLATGREVMPRLVRSVNGQALPDGRGGDMGLPEEWLKLMRDGMFGVVNDRTGTAYASRVIDDTVRISGKTGTSQVRNITAEERKSGVISNEDLPWERRDHALYVSYAPADTPRYAVSVVVEHGGGGSKAAAPVARDILMQALYGGLPPLEVYPVGQRDRIETERRALELRSPTAGVTAEKDRA